MTVHKLLLVGLTCSLAAVLIPAPAAQAQPQAITVSWQPSNPLIAHYSYSGASTRLKGIARGGATQFRWDFGDGDSTNWTNISDSYNLEVAHTYTGVAGQEFIAVLYVRDGQGGTDQATYRVKLYESSDLSDPDHLDVRINMAVDEALWYLHKTMNRSTYGGGSPGYGQPYGYWSDPGGYPLPAAGVAVDAFQLHGDKVNGDYDSNPYVETVQRGLNYILANARVYNISNQPAGNPDTNGNGIGIVCNNSTSNRQTYIGGICGLTVASSGAPNRIAATGINNVVGRRYADIVQDMCDFWAFGQVDSGSGRGGWRYYANYSGSDMSTAQWPPLMMIAAEENMGSTVPAFVRTELPYFLNYTYHSNCDGDHGCWGYDNPNNHINCTKAAAGIICHEFLHSPLDHYQVVGGLGFLYRRWNDSSSDWYHQRPLGNSYGMYGVMKAMRIPDPDITRIPEYNCSTGQQTGNDFDWYYSTNSQPREGLAHYLVRTQQSNGSWDDLNAPNPVYDAFSTGWRTLILLRGVTILPPEASICDCDAQEYNLNQDIHLDGTCSFHPDQTRTIVSYEWDFDYDGVNFVTDATGPQTIIPGGYPMTGLYPAALRVTDDNPLELGGPQTDIFVCEIDVHPPPHCPHAFIGGPYDGFIGVPIQLDASASWDPDNAIAAYEWDLDNDGLFGSEDNDVFGEPSDAVGITPTWTWDAPFTGVIGLRVTDEAGDFDACSDFSYTTVNVGNHAPVSDPNGPYVAAANTVITLDGSGSYDIDPGDAIASYEWDLDNDGEFDDATGVAPSFNVGPEANVTHDICLRVSDDFGEYDVACTAVSVLPYVPPDLTKDDGLEGGECLRPGDQITYTVCWDNLSNNFDVHNVVVTDQLPAELEFVSATGGGVYNSGDHTVTWAVGTLPAHADQTCHQLTVQIAAGTAQGSELVNTLTFTGDEAGTVVQTESTQLLTATVKLLVDQADRCVQPGGEITVTLAMSCLFEPVRAYQAFMAYDDSLLTFVEGEYNRPDPFNRRIINPITATNGQINAAAGVDDSIGQQPTTDDADLVYLTFTAGAAEGITQVTFRAHTPETQLGGDTGDPISVTMFDSPTIAIDGTAPIITCPADMNAFTDPGECEATLAITPATATDPGGSGIDSMQGVRSDGLDLLDPYPVGTTTITWTATDCAGNTASCVQTINVFDTERPTITCPADITQTADPDACEAVVTVPAPVVSDNCGVDTVTNNFTGTDDATGTYPVGTTLVTWTVTDIHGNSRQCTHTVTVTDDEAPVITCPPNITENTDAGVCQALVVVPAPAVTDNCEVAGFTNDFNGTADATDTYPVGVTQITWTVTDTAGNTAECVQTITVEDNEPPVIGCPAPITVTAEAGTCSAEVTVPAPTVDDNCGVAGFTNDYTGTDDASDTYPVGTTTVTWTVTDIYGNTAACTQDITVEDEEPPTITCPPDVEVNAEAGESSAFVSVPAPTGVSDNCAVADVVNDYNGTGDASDDYPLGTTTVTWTVTDAAGNTTTCTHDITVRGLYDVVVTVELSPTMTTGASPDILSRCITFELFECSVSDQVAAEVSAVIDFAVEDGQPTIGTAVLTVPVGAYDCITARDRLHTLRRTDEDFAIVGTEYVADFTGDPATGGDWLTGGNLNDDDFIDIVDFGLFMNQFASVYGSGDTTCATSAPHADINGDGVVTLADFTFVQVNFLKTSDTNCCPLLLDSDARPALRRPHTASPGAVQQAQRSYNRDLTQMHQVDILGSGPYESLTIQQMRQLGLSELQAADLNQDGILNTTDIQLFLANHQ